MKKLIYIFVLFITFTGFSQNANKRTASFNLENKIAIHGYDAVSYFKQGKAVKGKERNSSKL